MSNLNYPALIPYDEDGKLLHHFVQDGRFPHEDSSQVNPATTTFSLDWIPRPPRRWFKRVDVDTLRDFYGFKLRPSLDSSAQSLCNRNDTIDHFLIPISNAAPAQIQQLAPTDPVAAFVTSLSHAPVLSPFLNGDQIIIDSRDLKSVINDAGCRMVVHELNRDGLRAALSSNNGFGQRVNIRLEGATSPSDAVSLGFNWVDWLKARHQDPTQWRPGFVLEGQIHSTGKTPVLNVSKAVSSLATSIPGSESWRFAIQDNGQDITLQFQS